MKWPREGFTLVEIMVAIALLGVGVVTVLFGMHVAMVHTRYIEQMQTAMEAAEGQLEQLSATPVATLWASHAGDPLYPQYGERQDLLGTLHYWVLPVPLLPDGKQALPGGGVLGIQIRRSTQEPLPAQARGTPVLVDVHVAACWAIPQGWQGEDRNCDGLLGPGEDTNGNGWIDSVVMVSTRVGGGS